MVLVDHKGLLVDLADHIVQAHVLEFHGVPARVAPGQEQKLLHQVVHVVGLAFDGCDGLVQDGLVLFAPAVQHVGVALDHRDGCPELVGSVVDEPGLLQVGVVHPLQHVVHGGLDAL